MKIGIILKVLWKRHWWEALLFVCVSLILSGLLWKSSGDQFYKGLAWLEVASLVWLVTRVSLTQLGFGTFGGWRARPGGRVSYWIGEALFLTAPLLIAGVPRLFVVTELLQPSANDWSPLLESWGWSLSKIIALYVVCKMIGLGWERDDARARPRLAWGVILTLIVLSLTMSKYWGKRTPGSGTSQGFEIDPRDLPEVKDWQWLRTGHQRSSETKTLNLMRVPLTEGAVTKGTGLRVELVKATQSGETIIAKIKVTGTDLGAAELPQLAGLMLVFQNGYFGGTAQAAYERIQTRIPFLDLNQSVYTARLFTPLSLPENELSPDELLKDAELWISIGPPRAPVETRRRQAQKPKTSHKRTLRSQLALHEGKSNSLETRGLREMLMAKGEGVMEEVLEAAPWSRQAANDIVIPYLVLFAGENEKPRLLEMLKRDPLVGDVFMKKGWAKLAEPTLRERLETGKSLSQLSLIYLANLKEEAMTPRLENQLLRMSGDFDKAAEAVKNHPKVNWDRVRRMAWERMEAGFGRHHVWVKWGAEMGEKEALRILLREAHSGKKWEREVLKSWFGGDQNVVEKLRKNWESVGFTDGQWSLQK